MKESISLSTLLLVAFIVLKLCGVIVWSWVWVLSPAWMPIALGCLFILLLFAYGKLARMYFKMFQPDKWQKMQEISNGQRHNIVSKSKWEQRLAEMKTRQA